MEMPKDPFGYDNMIFFWELIKSSFCGAVGPECHTARSWGVIGRRAAGDTRTVHDYLKKIRSVESEAEDADMASFFSREQRQQANVLKRLR